MRMKSRMAMQILMTSCGRLLVIADHRNAK
jgi:hypothetical protein